MDINLSSVGTVRSTRHEPTDDFWDMEEVYLELTDEFSEESLYGLSDFSHLELIFFMDKVNAKNIVTNARHSFPCLIWSVIFNFLIRSLNTFSEATYLFRQVH